MSRRAQENIVVLLLLAFFAAALIMSLDYSPRARLVPIPIAGLAILLLLFQLVWQNLRPADELNVDLFDVLTAQPPAAGAAEPEAGRDDQKAEPAAETGVWRRTLIAVGFVALLVAMVMLAGPIPAIFVFTFGYFTLSGHYRPVKAALYTTAFTLAVYVIFVQVLQLQLYHGYLDPVAEYLRRL